MDKSRGEPIPNTLRVINDFKVRGKETPATDAIREFVKSNPNCKISDILKAFPERDDGSIRNTIRKMVESHKLIQRFSI